MIRALSRGIGAGVGGGAGRSAKLVDFPLLNEVPGKCTFSRASAQVFQDFEGNYRTAAAGEAAFAGARRVENLLPYSEDFSNASWGILTAGGGTVTISPDKKSVTCTVPPGGRAFVYRPWSTAPSLMSVYQTLLYGNPTYGTAGFGNAGSVTQGTGRASYLSSGASDVRFGLGCGGVCAEAASMTFTMPQVESVIGQSIQAPGEYIPTGATSAVRYFLTDLNVQGLRGPELVTNGGFDADASWTKGAGWSIAGGLLTAANAAGGTYTWQNDGITQGKTYEVTYSITAISSGSVQVVFNAAGNVAASGAVRSTVGTFTERLTAGSTGYAPNGNMSINAVGVLNASIDNVSIKEVLFPDTVRGTGQSLLALGPEMLTGGGFSSAAGWTTDAQWSISGGSANAVAAVNSQDVYQTNGVNLTAGKVYEVTYTVRNYVSGTVRFRVQKGAGASTFLAGRTANGTYTERFVSQDTGACTVYWEGIAGGAFTGSVDDASIKEVLYPYALKGILLEPTSTNKVTAYGAIPADTLGAELITNAADRDFSSDTGNWTKGTGVTISGGSLNFSGSAAGSTYYNPALVTPGRVYEFTYTITVVSGSFNISCKGTAGATRNASGTFTERFIAGSVPGSGWYINTAAGNFNGSIDNVSVKEVQFAIGTKSYATLGPELAVNGGFATDTDWTEGAGWSISGGVAVATAVTDTVAISEAIGTVGKQYQITYTIATRTAGGFKAKCGTALGSYQQNPGTYTEILTCAGNGNIGVQASGTASGSIDNVSVKEVTWQQNLSGWSLGSNSDISFAASIADYTAVISAAGMQGLAPTGKAYKLDNSTGATTSYVIISGATGNTNPHSYMIAAAVISGAPNVELTETGGSTLFLTGASLTFQKKENFTPTSTTQKLQIRVPAGAVLVVLFPQLEELQFCSSLMVTQGATATRAATRLTFPTAGNTKTADFTLSMEYTPTGQPTTRADLLAMSIDSANNSRFSIRMNDAGVNYPNVCYGTGNNALNVNALTYANVVGATRKLSVSVSSSAGVSLMVDGAVRGSLATPPALTHEAVAAIGSDTNNGTSVCCAYVKNFSIYRRLI